jgi:hypothetical protein
MMLMGAGGPPPSGPTYAFLGGSDNAVSSGLTETYPITMNGVAGRLIFATAIATGAVSSVVFDPSGANFALSLDYSAAAGGRPVAFYSANIGAFSGSKNIVVTYTSSPAFQQVCGHAWNASGLTTGFIAGSSGGASATISVTNGQLLFGVLFGTSVSGTIDFSGSTQTPTATRLATEINGNTTTQYSASADWNSLATNASFSVVPGYSFGATFAATYQ